ncbi:hypothetical protein CC1G_03168 [Coprinopsis cinerea okayama7|uniref:Uncharacterized protein n=1 Tax=Coprinopsis cinerea (strain Okayama-7 / 130 / ATCC MYA-4618 / FGSC 9003) TaxID=240176 RepID=A8PF63_COPC7|nr:hypothetical protein CC1G_03168 [Coprinopsis cinerea okayama7\|eukprot:XP_001840939.1 hypothetical protein CC1G_03168 [Coprinopsis cinerea okayama7\
MSNEGSSPSSYSYTTARNLARIARWCGPPRLKLGRAKELWAKASIRGAQDAPPRLARIKKSLRRVVKSSEDENENEKDKDEDEGVKGNDSDEEERELNQPAGVGEPELASGAEKDTEAGPSQHVTVSEANAPEMPSEEEENLTVSGSETQESEREASTQPDQDIDAGTSEETVAVTPKKSDNAAPNFKSNGKKNLEKEKETVSGSAPQGQLTVPATRRSARLATKEVHKEDSSTQHLATTADNDKSEQPATTATTVGEATNTDVIDKRKSAPRRSARIKKVPAQAASTPAHNPGPSTKDVVEAVSAVVSTIKGPAPTPKSKQTRGQKRKRTATSEEEEEEGLKNDETGRSDGNAKSKSNAGTGTAKGAGTRKAKRARKSGKDEEETTTRAGEKENTTESAPANLAQNEVKDGEKKITIRVPVKAVKRTRGSKKTKA